MSNELKKTSYQVLAGGEEPCLSRRRASLIALLTPLLRGMSSHHPA